MTAKLKVVHLFHNFVLCCFSFIFIVPKVLIPPQIEETDNKRANLERIPKYVANSGHKDYVPKEQQEQGGKYRTFAVETL